MDDDLGMGFVLGDEIESARLIYRVRYLPYSKSHMLMIQFFHNGAEYTTRARLEAKYKLPHTSLQTILEDKRLKRIVQGNKFYFLKVQAEQAVEAYVQQQLIAKAAKKKYPLPMPKFESLLRFSEHQAPRK